MNQLTKVDPAALAAADPGAAFELFDQAAARFLATRNSERTRRTYDNALRLYKAACEENNLPPFSGDALIAYDTRLQALRGVLANDTLRLRMKVLQSFFTWLYAFGLSSLKPDLVSELITLPPARKLSPRDILTDDEARALLDNAQFGRDSLLVRLLLDGGLRISEALALRRADVYTAYNRFYVFVARGKGDKSRDVEVSADLWRSLGSQGDPLFLLDRSNAWRMIQRTAAAAGIEKHLTPHSLRHTHAHHLRMAGWPLEMIAARLGHASLETTKLYTRPAEMARLIELPHMPWNTAT